MSNAPIDLIGLRVGRLLVISREGNRGTRRQWRCICDCGQEVLKRTVDLRSQNPVASCGCVTRERLTSPEFRALQISVTHGMAGTPTHQSWGQMIQRCTNPKRRHWRRYGGRGITVCDQWRRSFESFFADMGERPRGCTLDRIDNDRGYEPGNCRWTTPAVQARNSSNAKLTVDAVNEIRGRAEHGESQTSIAARFAITVGHVNNVVARRSWGSVP